MQSLACLNGKMMPVDEARVPVMDRGFLFGDSVYEVMRIYAGRCWQEEAHQGRLKRSLAAMEYQPVDLEKLKAQIHRTIQESGVKEGTVYIQVTRGVAPRRHAFPDPPVPPTELVVVRPYDDAPVARMRASGVGVISHPDLRWKRCDVKSTNLLANVLAAEAARQAGAIEAVLVGEDGLVTEATHSSVVWVREGRLEGTPEGPGILPGTTRSHLLELAAEEGIPFAPARVRLEELATSDEVILAGTTIEVLPVVTVDGASVGDGRPGPYAARLQAAFRRALGDWLEGA